MDYSNWFFTSSRLNIGSWHSKQFSAISTSLHNSSHHNSSHHNSSHHNSSHYNSSLYNNSLYNNSHPNNSLPNIIVSLLTPNVTQFLPPNWQGPFTFDQAKQWIQERDQECSVLVVQENHSLEFIGLVILFEESEIENAAGDSTRVKPTLRLGYLLAESAWGQGYASELVGALVENCKKSGIGSIIGGVDKDNLASRKVLEKAGFRKTEPESFEGELIYRLEF